MVPMCSQESSLLSEDSVDSLSRSEDSPFEVDSTLASFEDSVSDDESESTS